MTNTATGTIVVSGAGKASFYDDVVNDGEVRVSAGSSVVYFGALSGAGSFTGTGTSYIEGDLQPGHSAEIVVFEGDVVFGRSAAVEIELGGTSRGTEYDAVVVLGDLTLDSTLEVLLIGGFQPAHGDAFDILDWGTRSGEFAQVVLPPLGDALGWDTSALYTTGTLTVVPQLTLGDVNGDGNVDNLDITPFVMALMNDQASFYLLYPDGEYWAADCYADGNVDNLDITPFVEILTGGGEAVPGPATLSLLALGALALIRRRSRRS